MRVSLATSRPAVEREVEVAAGATVADVLRAGGISVGNDETLGVWGRVVAPDHPVGAGDRVEVYRPLPVDAKEARRLRAAAQRRAQKRR